MAIHPNPKFPLLESDQAEVIQLFLELMREADRAESASQVAANQPVELRNDSKNSRTPDELRDLE